MARNPCPREQGGRTLGPAGSFHRAPRTPSHGLPTGNNLMLARPTNGAADTGMKVAPYITLHHDICYHTRQSLSTNNSVACGLNLPVPPIHLYSLSLAMRNNHTHIHSFDPIPFTLFLFRAQAVSGLRNTIPISFLSLLLPPSRVSLFLSFKSLPPQSSRD